MRRLPVSFGKRRSSYAGMSPYGRRRRRGGSFRLWPIALFLAFGVYYYFSNLQVVAITGRKQIVDISQTDEVALGLNSYNQILNQSQVVPSGKEVDLIRAVGAKIAASTGNKDFPWEFNLIDSPEANAFALPGGKVAVYTGILPIVQNVDGLAVVMGHEVAHAIARHGAERMAHGKLMQWGTMAVGASVGEMDYTTQRTVMGAFGVGSKFGAMLPFSRKHESEADYMGLIYVAKSCFNPEEAPKVWERMMKASSGQGQSDFMSTHPSPATRIENFKEWMPEALKIRAENCGNGKGVAERSITRSVPRSISTDESF